MQIAVEGLEHRIRQDGKGIRGGEFTHFDLSLHRFPGRA